MSKKSCQHTTTVSPWKSVFFIFRFTGQLLKSLLLNPGLTQDSKEISQEPVCKLANISSDILSESMVVLVSEALKDTAE